MQVSEALRNRKSIRAFIPKPVPKEVVAQILEEARWSPSWGNTQPWELVVVGQETTGRLTEELVAVFSQRLPANPDVPMPDSFPDALKERYMACAAGLFGTMGIAREDKAARWAHMLNMTRAYGAPTLIYVLFKADLQVPYTMFDLGALTHAICLAAQARGLGTCIEAQLALYPEVVRRHLGLTEAHKIVVGIALGYPDLAAPANAFRTTRLEVGDFVTWVD